MDKATALIIVRGFGDLVMLGQILAAFLVILFILKRISKKNKTINKMTQFIQEYGLIFSFFIALIAMSGSLFFSEVAHFIPCKLCWYQRICMYPQVLILGIAAVKNDFKIKKYLLPLSAIGAIIAAYHYLLQMSPIPLPCSDEVANCALKQFAFFGYITIPLMSLTAFVLIILFLSVARSKESKK